MSIFFVNYYGPGLNLHIYISNNYVMVDLRNRYSDDEYKLKLTTEKLGLHVYAAKEFTVACCIRFNIFASLYNLIMWKDVNAISHDYLNNTGYELYYICREQYTGLYYRFADISYKRLLLISIAL